MSMDSHEGIWGRSGNGRAGAGVSAGGRRGRAGNEFRASEETRATHQRAVGFGEALATLAARGLDGGERVVEEDAGEHAAPEAVDQE
jgi:hypothetical protein